MIIGLKIKQKIFILYYLIKQMDQTKMDMIEPQSIYDYQKNPRVQDSPGFFSKFLFFNRLQMLYSYISKISKETLYRYNESFEPMISNNKILNDFKKRQKKQSPFSIASQIYRLQQRGIITLIVLSIAAGLASLVPIYFQFILVKAVMGNTGNYYSISVIVCSMFARFILLNYSLNLSNNIALNAKIYIQNSFMRAVFIIKQFSPSAKYFDVDLIGQAFYYVPYLIISQIIIVGDIIFVFLQVGVYGWIVLAIYCVFYFLIALCGKAAFQIMHQNSIRRTERETFEKKSLSALVRVALQRVQEYVFRLLVVQKTLQLKDNLKINLLYILGQTFGQCCIVLSNIILYALTDQQGIANIFSYYSVLFMVACFYPMRYSVYGFFTIIKAYEAYLIISSNLSSFQTANLKFIPQKGNQMHLFAENVGDCFEYPDIQIQDDQPKINYQSAQNIFQTSSNLKETSQENFYGNNNLQSLDQGEILMVFTRVDSKPSISEFLKELIDSKPNGKTLLTITSAHFVLPLNVKDNILFYSPYNDQKFKTILQITQLCSLPQSFWLETSRLDHKNLKFNKWYQTRIELARALYNDVDYLIMNKQNLFDDLSLLTAVFAERRARNKVTVLINNTHKYYFEIADKILVIGKGGQRQVGTYKELKRRRDSLFNQMFLNHHEKIDNSAKILQQKKLSVRNIHFNHKQTKQPHLQKSTFFEFFNFAHRKAEFVILITVFLPPLFKYYVQYLIGTSVNTNIFGKYLIFGLIYLFFILLRGFVLSVYTNISSLSLFRKICSKLKLFNMHQISEFYQRPFINYDFHSKNIDRNLVMDFEYGQSVLVEIIVSFVVYCTGQPAYIFVAIPVIIGIVFLNSQYMKHARMIYLIKLKETRGFNHIILAAADSRQQIQNCQKSEEFNQSFHKENRIEIIYNSNIEWLQTGVRTIVQLMVLLSFVLFLIIMVYTVQNVTIYTSLVSLGCSMFINLMYLNTFYLKAFRQMEISLVSLTLCMDILKKNPQPTVRQLLRVLEPKNIKFIQFVDVIQFRGASLRFFPHQFGKIWLRLQAGDRLVLSGNSNTNKELIFYMLENKLFDSQQIRGDLVINGEVHRQFCIDGLFFLHSNPIIPFIGTIYDAFRYSKPKIDEFQVDQQIDEFFEVMELTPVFEGKTQVDSLTVDQKELFEIFRVVVIKQCKVLVIINGLDSIDIVSRRKLMRWIINLKTINIVIQTTNLRQIVELYPKRYKFQGQSILLEEEEKIEENLQEQQMSQNQSKYSRSRRSQHQSKSQQSQKSQKSQKESTLQKQQKQSKSQKQQQKSQKSENQSRSQQQYSKQPIFNKLKMMKINIKPKKIVKQFECLGIQGSNITDSDFN